MDTQKCPYCSTDLGNDYKLDTCFDCGKRLMNTQIPEQRKEFKKSVIALSMLEDIPDLTEEQVNLICNNFDFYLNQAKSHWIAEVRREVEGLKRHPLILQNGNKETFNSAIIFDDVLQLPSLTPTK